LLDALVLLLQY